MSVGLDVSGKSLVAYAVNERKPRVFAGKQPATRAGLGAMLRQVGAGAKLVVFEAGNQMKWIAETLKQIDGMHVPVVHPNEVMGITESGGKTDRVEMKQRAALVRGGLLPQAGPVGEGRVRELREVVSARQQLQRKRIALINTIRSSTIRGSVDQEGHRLPEQCFAGAEQRLTARLQAIEDPRGPLRERSPAIGPLAARVLVSVLDEARRFDDQKAVAHDGALAPTIYQQSGTV